MSWVWLVVPEILTMNFLLKHIHLALQERLENEIEASIVVFLVFCFIYLNLNFLSQDLIHQLSLRAN